MYIDERAIEHRASIERPPAQLTHHFVRERDQGNARIDPDAEPDGYRRQQSRMDDDGDVSASEPPLSGRCLGLWYGDVVQKTSPPLGTER
jgi:hypothetical protein